MEKTKIPALIYTEATPNPETLKFVSNKSLLPGAAADFPDIDSANNGSPLASELFGFPFVKGVFISDTFVTITKTQHTEWHEVIPSVREFLKDYLTEEKEVLTDQYRLSLQSNAVGNDANTIEEKIKQMLDKYVMPAVQMDGGAIVFRSYEDGIVHLSMQGACSGCPSATITLKAGIEGLLKRMIPEVKEVVADSI